MPGHALQALLPRALIAAAIAVTCACGSAPRKPATATPSAGPGPETTAPAPEPRPPAEPPAANPNVAVPSAAGDFGPEVLLPATSTADDEVARVGDLTIHKRHIYERLLVTESVAARKQVEMLVLEALIAREAERHGIRVSGPQIDAIVRDNEARLRRRIKRELPKMTYERFLARQWERTPEELEAWWRTNAVRGLFREYVLRFLSLRQERVEVRYVLHSDRATLEDVAAKVRQGADFARLARDHSEDDRTRQDGGKLPPFARSFEHPVTETAFGLTEGELSDILAREDGPGGATRYYLIYCLRRIPARDVTFAEVKTELDEDIENRPMTPGESEAAATLLLQQLEALNSATDKR